MLLTRLLTVVILVPVVLAAIFCPYWQVFGLFIQACVTAALFEYFTLVGFSKVERLFGVAVGTLHGLYLLLGPGGETLLWEMLLVVAVGFLFFLRYHPGGLEGIASRLGFFVLGQFYVATMGPMVGMVRTLPDGIFWVLVLLAMTWLNDTAAYFFGHRWGRRRLAPEVSPGKSVEGFLGGFLGSFVGYAFFWAVIDNPLSFQAGLPLVFLVGVAAPLGDLAESLLKRSFRVKDSGTLIPGHGGMLDRIDALFFTAPLVYYYARWIG